jgi:hypothetical protein
MNLLGFGKNNTKPSLLKDPFKKDKIKEVWIYCTYNEWKGHIHFNNGNTEGTQRFKGYKTDEFQKLLTDMQNFAESL